MALIAIVGSIPYIALQLKAVSSSLGTILTHLDMTTGMAQPVLGDIALFVALAMAAFAVLFGTRHIDATEHQDGLILAIATESLIKLVAFVTVGVFVTFVMFDGPMACSPRRWSIRAPPPRSRASRCGARSITMTLLSTVAIVLLPRQFHVTVVENHSEAEVRRAAWLFPIYLVLINLFVIPIAVAGLITFAPGSVDSDMFVLALPLSAGSEVLALVAFVGGLSAATAMVIVETVALAIMASNDIVVPLGAAAARGDPLGPRGRRRDPAHGAADRDLRDPAARLHVLPLGRRGAARLDRPALLRGGGAARAGLLRRPDLARRHRARARSPA